MYADANKAAAIAIVESIGAGRLALAAFSEDAIWWMQGQGELPVGRIAEMIQGFHAGRLSGEGRMEVRGITTENDRVAVEAECFFPLTTGILYSNTYHFLILFRDGKACLVREYFDTARAGQAFRRP